MNLLHHVADLVDCVRLTSWRTRMIWAVDFLRANHSISVNPMAISNITVQVTKHYNLSALAQTRTL